MKKAAPGGGLEWCLRSVRVGGSEDQATMRYVSILPICLLLAGCMTAATPVSHMSYSQLQEVARQVEQRCVDQGVNRQSPQFEACVRQEANRETTLRQERRQMMMGGTVCNKVGSAVICD